MHKCMRINAARQRQSPPNNQKDTDRYKKRHMVEETNSGNHWAHFGPALRHWLQSVANYVPGPKTQMSDERREGRNGHNIMSINLAIYIVIIVFLVISK